MTGKKYGSVWTIDPSYPLFKTNQSNETDMPKSVCWINSRPMYYRKNSSIGGEIVNHLYIP